MKHKLLLPHLGISLFYTSDIMYIHTSAKNHWDGSTISRRINKICWELCSLNQLLTTNKGGCLTHTNIHHTRSPLVNWYLKAVDKGVHTCGAFMWVQCTLVGKLHTNLLLQQILQVILVQSHCSISTTNVHDLVNLVDGLTHHKSYLTTVNLL